MRKLQKKAYGTRSLIFSWGMFYFVLFAYRSVFSVLGEVVVMRLTGIPDTVTYQNSSASDALEGLMALGFSSIGLQMQYTATLVTKLVGGIFNLLTAGNPILINIGFQSIGFLGLYILLSAVPVHHRRFLSVLVMTPSFTLWSSIASKESIVVLLICIICKYIINIYLGNSKLKSIYILSMVLLFLFKPHFLIAILFIVIGSLIARNVRQKATIAIIGCAVSLVPLYIFRDLIDDFALSVTIWLAAEKGRSSREPFLTEQYDVFLKAPEGMFKAFFGPVASEATSGILHAFSFVESSLIVGFVLLYLIQQSARLPVYNFLVGVFALFWVMFPNFPQGVANPGTAIRYRTDYIILVFIVIVFLMTREAYFGIRSKQAAKPVGRQVSSTAGSG